MSRHTAGPWSEAPAGPSPLRDILAGMLRGSGRLDDPVLRCMCGEHDLTAGEMAEEIETGTDTGRVWASSTLRVARDVLAARGPQEGLDSGLSEAELDACRAAITSFLEEADGSRPALPGGPGPDEMALAVRAGTDEGLDYVAAAMTVARSLLAVRHDRTGGER